MVYYLVSMYELPKMRFATAVNTTRYRNRFPGTARTVELSMLEEGTIYYEGADGTERRYDAPCVMAVLPDFKGRTWSPVGTRNRHITAGATADLTYRAFDPEVLEKEELDGILAGLSQGNRFLLPQMMPTGELFSPLRSYEERLAALYADPDPASSAETVAAFLSLLAAATKMCVSAIRRAGDEPISAGAEAMHRRAVAYMKEHLADPLTAASVASVLGVSEGYLFRLFRIAGEVGPMATLTDLRMSAAASLARASDAPAYEIAAQVGYSDPLHFSRVFRKTQGITFSAYRKQNR